MTGHEIKDITSGFRVVRAEQFREFLHLLPNGFSYPTTITMAFFRSAYAIAYEPIPVYQRVGTTSHIRPLKDGLRFLLIIFKIATLYSPLKLFAPTSLSFFALGLGYYGYTFCNGPSLHEHERPALQCSGHHLSDRPGVRANHVAGLQQVAELGRGSEQSAQAC